jgi:hypothetical protein
MDEESVKGNFVVIYELIDGAVPKTDFNKSHHFNFRVRNSGLWLSPEHGVRCPKDVYHDGRN